MQVETLEALAVILWILSGVLFLAAGIFFGIFQVPKLIAELTGSAKRKRIAAITSQQSSGTGYSRQLKPHFALPPSQPLGEKKTAQKEAEASPETTLLQPEKPAHTYAETTLLRTDAVQTTVLHERDAGGMLPILQPDVPFAVIEEFRFVGSSETAP